MKTADLVTTKQVCEALKISDTHLYSLREEGLLKLGTHYLDVSRPSAARPTYRWNLAAIREALKIPPEKRG